MHITLSPQRALPGQPETTIFVNGDTITVDGTLYDLSAVPEGGEGIPKGENHPFVGRISREGGTIRATVRARLGENAEPDQPADPAHWIIPEADGAVSIPAIRKEDFDA